MVRSGSLHMLVFKQTSKFITAILLFVASSYAEQDSSLRIISLAPNLTEIIYDLGLGENIVGVSNYCDYPKEVHFISKVGDFKGINFEKIISLKPDIVFVLESQKTTAENLRKLNFKVELFSIETLSDIYQATLKLGAILNKEVKAKQLVKDLQGKISNIRTRNTTQSARVLVVVGGHGDSIGLIYVAAASSLYHELLTLLGVRNVLQEKTAYIKISAESVFALDPDIIIDLMPESSSTTAWSKLKTLRAVRNSNVYVLSEEFLVNPGPRVYQTLEAFSEILKKSNV